MSARTASRKEYTPMKASLTLLVVGYLLAAPASAQTVERMTDGCRFVASESTEDAPQDAVFCFAYIEALNSALQGNCQMPNNKLARKIGYLPSTAAGARAFLLWVDKHPEALKMPFYQGMVSALEEAFPCDW